jgi:hypothetical protein
MLMVSSKPFRQREQASQYDILGFRLWIHRLQRIDFQPLEDQIAGKLGAGSWKIFTMAR